MPEKRLHVQICVYIYVYTVWVNSCVHLIEYVFIVIYIHRTQGIDRRAFGSRVFNLSDPDLSVLRSRDANATDVG